MEMVKILRLITGEDVISYIKPVDDLIVLKFPMEMYLKTEGKTGNEILNLNNWLPFSLLKTKETVIQFKNVLCIMEPSDEVAEYYENAILSLQDDDISSNVTSDKVSDLKTKMLENFLKNWDPELTGSIQ